MPLTRGRVPTTKEWEGSRVDRKVPLAHCPTPLPTLTLAKEPGGKGQVGGWVGRPGVGRGRLRRRPESGDDEVLKLVVKGSTAAEHVEAAQRIKVCPRPGIEPAQWF